MTAVRVTAVRRRAWLVAGLVVVLYATLFPFDFHVPRGRTWGDVVADVDLTLLSGYVVTDVVLNVALFLPFGYGVARVIGARRVHRAGVVVVMALAGGAALAAVVEVLQGFALARHPSVTDVAANAMGAVVGASAAVRWGDTSVQRLAARGAAAIGSKRRGVVLVCIGAFAVLVAGSALLPIATRPSGWDLGHPLLIGNERTGDRPWRGRVEGVHLMDRAASDDEVRHLMDDPAGLVDRDPAAFVVAHDFTGGTGGFPHVVPDGAGAVSTGASGVRLDGTAWLVTPVPATDVSRAIDRASAFTLAIAVAPDDLAQRGPARIVSISDGLRSRNLTVGQEGRDLAVRIRTPLTGADGTSPELVVPAIFRGDRTHDIVLRYDGVELVVGVDGDPVVHSVALAPATAALVAAFPLRTERLRIGTPGSWIRHATFAALVFAPVVVALRARPLGPGWSVVVVGAALGLNAVVRRSSSGPAHTMTQMLLLDLLVVAVSWPLWMSWSVSSRVPLRMEASR